MLFQMWLYSKKQIHLWLKNIEFFFYEVCISIYAVGDSNEILFCFGKISGI